MRRENWYKGYCALKEKGSITPLKDESKWLTYEEAEKYPGGTGIGGILRENVVFVDIDDEYQKDRAMSIIREKKYPVIVRETTRGIHILALNNGSKEFEHPDSKVKLACGLTADIKTGKKVCYEAFNVEGVEREVIYEADEIGEMPKAFEPVKMDVDFVSMQEGERNNALFAHVGRLIRAGFSKEEVKNTIRIINEYVLRSPLDEREVETIVRDEVFHDMDSFSDGKRFLHNVFGDWLIRELHIVRINGQLHSYERGFYIPGTRKIERRMRKNLPKIRNHQIKETISYIDSMCESVSPAPPNYIGVDNGILDINTMEMLDFSPDIVITNRIPWNYNPNAQSKVVDECLDAWALGDKDIVKLLEESMGYSLYRNNIFRALFILTGSKANGKSTFLDLYKHVIGEGNYSCVDLYRIGDRFQTAFLAGMLANIGDDISDEYINGNEAAVIKKVVTGETLTVERKNEDPFNFTPYSTLIFSANEIPNMRDRTGALADRMVIIPFRANFTKAPDCNLREKLHTREAAEAMLKRAVDGLKRLLKNQRFTMSKAVEAEKEQFELTNDPIKSFLNDYIQTGDELYREPVSVIYRNYCLYCSENGYKAVSSNAFGRKVREFYKVESYQKKVAGRVTTWYKSKIA